MEQDPKQLAIYFARVRAGIGLAMVLLPGLTGRVMLGRDANTPTSRALVRMIGIRDLVLGVGALTALNETEHGPDWVGVCAVVDGIDAVALTFGPGLVLRARPTGLVAGALAAVQLELARRLADEREAANPTIPAEVRPAEVVDLTTAG
jgi:hypothetical protein